MAIATGKSKGRRINQSQLASLAGVSRATVSRALSGHPGISDEVVSRIEALARKLDYRPSAAARSFVTQVNNVLGMVVCNRTFDSPVYAGLMSGVERWVRERDLKLQVSWCDVEHIDRSDTLPPIFRDDGVDGVILTGAVPERLLERLSKWEMPVVLLGSLPGFRGVNQVAGDARRGGELIARHLMGMGHERIGIMVGPRSRPLHQQYFEGFRDACREVGMDDGQIERRVQEVYSVDAVNVTAALLEREPDLTAIFCDTDLVAWQVIQFLRARGIDVPRQFSVAGAGRVCRSLNVPLDLTTVDVQFDQMCRVAVDLLQELVKDSSVVARRIVVEPCVAPGNTAAAPLRTQKETTA